MKTLNKQSGVIFRKLISLMGKENHLRINNSNDAFMPLTIERLYDLPESKIVVYSLSHYYESNGDLIPDPDMTFAVNDNFIMPLTYQDTFSYDEAITIKPMLQDWLIKERTYNNLVSFANLWLRNIKEQQNL